MCNYNDRGDVKERELKSQTVLLMVSAMHEYLGKLVLEAQKTGNEPLTYKLSAARAKLFKLKMSSQSLVKNNLRTQFKIAA